MGLLDVLLGRTKPVRPDLDQLFGLSSAAITLQAASELRPTGTGSVCFAAVEGGAFSEIQQDLHALLSTEASRDSFGYNWLLSRHDPEDVTGLVTDLHAINSTLEQNGFGPQLLCSLVGFADSAGGSSLALGYLYKRGSFYPVCKRPGEQKRDNARELEIAALLKNDLRIESDLSRWFPVWGAPGMAD
jgi:hypothetical protein